MSNHFRAMTPAAQGVVKEHSGTSVGGPTHTGNSGTTGTGPSSPSGESD
jgi:hypothetical protein